MYMNKYKRYFRIDQLLVRHFVNYGAGLSMQTNNYPFLQFNDLLQSGNRVEILVNCGIPITLILFYSIISFIYI